MEKKPDNKDTYVEEENDLLTARRMFLRKYTLAVPLILAAFTASQPASAQATCIPTHCNPGFSCYPDGACDPSCGPGQCGPDKCRPGRT
ncbi:MAG: hypothetical protein GY762_07785 [Proteobacteria bacterium]|nr:hypothetical protein [Pseudomonadota bacterium]